MKDENFIQIAGWMVNREKLSGKELLCYALIYGFSQDGSWCTCTLKYIAEWLGTSKRTVMSTIQSLIDKGKIEKETEEKSGVKFCKYRAITSIVVKKIHHRFNYQSYLCTQHWKQVRALKLKQENTNVRFVVAHPNLKSITTHTRTWAMSKNTSKTSLFFVIIAILCSTIKSRINHDGRYNFF